MHKPEAIRQLSLAIKNGEYKKSTIENELGFSSLKTNKDFLALLKKLE